MASQITANLPTLNFPREVDYPTQEDWAAFSAEAELNFGILGNDWSTQMQLWKTQANAMSTELNTNANIAQSTVNYKGDWISQGYALNESVSVDGIYYICKLTHSTGQNPIDVSSLYWNLAIGNWNLKVDTNMSGYTSKTTPVDADLIPLSDSASSFGIKKLSWANVKATLKTYFDTLYVTLSGNQTVNGIKTFSSNIVGNITGNAATATVATLAQTANLASISDVGNSVANTTFVYRAQGNLKLQSGVLGNVTLTQDMAGQMLIMAGTPTLPPINSIWAGSCFYLLNSTTAAISIGLNGNSLDTNYPVIYPKETLILQSDGSTTYRVVSRSREFASIMNASAGYSFLENGLLLQWGYAFPSIAPGGGVLDITFPIAFPNGVFFSDASVVTTSVNNQISTPFVVATSNTNLRITNNDVDSYITQIRWFSIGY